MAPNAAPNVQAKPMAVTIVVRRSSGANSWAMLGRLSEPASFFAFQAGDLRLRYRVVFSRLQVGRQ